MKKLVHGILIIIFAMSVNSNVNSAFAYSYEDCENDCIERHLTCLMTIRMDDPFASYRLWRCQAEAELCINRCTIMNME